MDKGKKQTRAGQKSRKPPKYSAPRTKPVRSHSRPDRVKHSRAKSDMSITQLHFMARSLGIPFGGLNKGQLVKEINRYKL
jgi:hypothetical protein